MFTLVDRGAVGSDRSDCSARAGRPVSAKGQAELGVGVRTNEGRHACYTRTRHVGRQRLVDQRSSCGNLASPLSVPTRPWSGSILRWRLQPSYTSGWPDAGNRLSLVVNLPVNIVIYTAAAVPALLRPTPYAVQCDRPSHAGLTLSHTPPTLGWRRRQGSRTRERESIRRSSGGVRGILPNRE